jgi:ABC-type Zn uptake system ZnuABC Zn-binding protein ZnuA
MSRRPLRTLAALLAGTVLLTGCAGTGSPQREADAGVTIVATSAIVADFAAQIAGDAAEVTTLIPNGFDSHTYEPKPSELVLLGDADLVVLADANLNAAITGLVRLSGHTSRMLDLNAASFRGDDFVYREPGNTASVNPHTWTSPLLAARWVSPLTEAIVGLAPDRERDIRANANALAAELVALDESIREALRAVPSERRKLVVYHDAWEYFGREYDLEVVGALQAVNFAEPSAAELSRMVSQIRQEGVRVFFGSEVFPSDVLEALEAESGARYVPDLADDRLPGEPGESQHTYVALMRANLALLMDGLIS